MRVLLSIVLYFNQYVPKALWSVTKIVADDLRDQAAEHFNNIKTDEVSGQRELTVFMLFVRLISHICTFLAIIKTI